MSTGPCKKAPAVNATFAEGTFPDVVSCTAILISGQTRSFADCLRSQIWKVYGKLHNPYFFASVADDADAKDIEILRDHFEHVWIEKVAQPDLEEKPAYKQAMLHAPYGNSTPVQAILRQFWHLQRVWQFCKASAPKGVRAATFIRMRPDSAFVEFAGPHGVWGEQVIVPPWGNYGGCHDRFAMIAGTNAAAIYFNVFEAIDELVRRGCPFHPESLLEAWLTSAKVPINRTLAAEFNTIYNDGRPMRYPIYYAGDIFKYVAAKLDPLLAAPRIAPTPNRPAGPGASAGR